MLNMQKNRRHDSHGLVLDIEAAVTKRLNIAGEGAGILFSNYEVTPIY